MAIDMSGNVHMNVSVLAIDGNWAMVRHPHCIPFVVDSRKLQYPARELLGLPKSP